MSLESVTVKSRQLKREKWGSLIDGVTEMPSHASTYGVEDPTTGSEIAHVLSGDAALADRAVETYRLAYEERS